MTLRIGLVRHFKVKKEFPERKLVTQGELIRWFEEYDEADIEYGDVDLGSYKWGHCYSSDMSRASKTANTIYKGKIVELKELREIRAYRIFGGNLRLPLILWGLLIKLAWLLNHKSQLERRTDIQKRVRYVLDKVCSECEGDVLIVAHGALMLFLRKELLKRGFRGPRFRTPSNGVLYAFEK